MKRNSKKLKIGIRAIVIICLLNITSLLLISMGSNTPPQQDETNLLFNMWHLETYKIESKVYPLNKKEKDDYILFKKDMTYTSKSEGKKDDGTFILNTNGAYVLMNSENGEKVKAYIISISNKSLVLKYDIDEIRDIEVHYTSPNQTQKL
ncbi:lipocalin family protein [Winogradskyella sp. UBA3174]|uniref:lipocalin family protein n=1 Tax=Winogradskyella sp. UBA3174 TaxID=1947785 RepID=UPI0025D254F7|nr:lipocalin family protein [Winogradskyella sp. UBA3174]